MAHYSRRDHGIFLSGQVHIVQDNRVIPVEVATLSPNAPLSLAAFRRRYFKHSHNPKKQLNTGEVRQYWRHRQAKKALRGEPGSREFAESYLEAARQLAHSSFIETKRHTEGATGSEHQRTFASQHAAAIPTAKGVTEKAHILSPSVGPLARAPRQLLQLRASEIAARYGFTPRYWIKRAAAGKIPGARQPSGPRGGWLFDGDLFETWWRGLPRQESVAWQTYIDAEQSGGAVSNAMDAVTGAASRRRIEALLNAVLDSGLSSSKASRSAKRRPVPSLKPPGYSSKST